MTIKLWDWEKGWKCVQVFEGHSHYVMGLSINPKDTNTFASACLDRTVKIWNLGSGHANYTLEAHGTVFPWTFSLKVYRSALTYF